LKRGCVPTPPTFKTIIMKATVKKAFGKYKIGDDYEGSDANVAYLIKMGRLTEKVEVKLVKEKAEVKPTRKKEL